MSWTPPAELGLRMPGCGPPRCSSASGMPDTVDQLRRVYESFTEGFDDPDLVDARAALAELDLAVG